VLLDTEATAPGTQRSGTLSTVRDAALPHPVSRLAGVEWFVGEPGSREPAQRALADAPRMTQRQRIVRIMLSMFAWMFLVAVMCAALSVDSSRLLAVLGVLPGLYAFHLLDLHREQHGKDEHPRRY
jgi:hypothetical protein